MIKEYANPNCYARQLGNCSRKLSREHFVSKSLLKLIETPRKMTMQGPAWLPNNEERSVSSESLSAKILCEKHNSILSGLDNTAKEFCDFFINLESETITLELDYRLLERWMLKLLCGLIASGYIKGFSNWMPNQEWLDILFLDAQISRGDGLYYLMSNKRLTGKNNEFAVWPIVNQTHEIVGIHFLLAGYPFLFLIGGLPREMLKKHFENGFGLIYRPQIFRIEYKGLVKQLNLGTNNGETITLGITTI